MPTLAEEKRQAALIAAAQRYLLPFVVVTYPEYHVSAAHRFLAGKLEAFERAVKEGKSPRLMVFLPPRFGKSELTSRRYPGWLLGRNPDWNVGIVSYGAELAEELSADARRVVLSDEYAAVFGSLYQPEPGGAVEIDRSSQAVNHWRIAGRRGGVRAVGVGGALTGRGFHVLVIDDPIKGRNEADSDLVREDLWRFYQGTLRTRLEPGGGILLVQTRWHHDDLAGRLLRQPGHQWEVINLPALAEDRDPLGRDAGEPLDPERFTRDALEALREGPDAVSPRDWLAQYQGRPTPDEGAIFQRDWFLNEPDPHLPGPTFQYWDTSFGKSQRGGDWTVCGTWRLEQNAYRLIDVYRSRDPYPVLKERAVAIAAVHHPRLVVVEDAASGQSLIQDLRVNTRLPVVAWKVDRDKVSRAHAVTGQWASKRARLSLPDHVAQTFIDEHLLFPEGDHDDQVDMGAMALAHLSIWQARSNRRVVTREFRVVA